MQHKQEVKPSQLKACLFSCSLPNMLPPAPPRLLAEGLDGLAQHVLHSRVPHTLIGRLLEQLGGSGSGEELVEDGVEDDASYTQAEGDHAHRGGSLGAFLCCNKSYKTEIVA